MHGGRPVGVGGGVETVVGGIVQPDVGDGVGYFVGEVGIGVGDNDTVEDTDGIGVGDNDTVGDMDGWVDGCRVVGTGFGRGVGSKVGEPAELDDGVALGAGVGRSVVV